jgi:LacI family transcriptional regulator
VASRGPVELGPPSSIEHSREAVKRLLGLSPPPTAVVLGSVQHTVGVLEGLYQTGVEVPRELSVVGFGDEPGFSWWGPGLTTISLPIPDMAAACGLWFIRRLSSRSTDDSAYASVSPGSLLIRGSTAPPPASRKRSA